VYWGVSATWCSFLEAAKRVINNPAMTARYTSNTSRPIPAPAPPDSEAYKVIQSAVARNYDTIAIPMMGTGAPEWRRFAIRVNSASASGPRPISKMRRRDSAPHRDQERTLEAELYGFVRFSYEIVYDLARRN
jgi:acetylornithine deacetylase/succinyl-diaminopimelate desuccinylase-like protein